MVSVIASPTSQSLGAVAKGGCESNCGATIHVKYARVTSLFERDGEGRNFARCPTHVRSEDDACACDLPMRMRFACAKR